MARELLRRKVPSVVVIEKESTPGCHASTRNSGVIHSGINQKPGTLKAAMCLEGSARLRAYCREKKVDIRECGTLVVARDREECTVLEELLAMGRSVGVPHLELISRGELERREPMARGIKALFSPTGAVVDAAGVMAALCRDITDMGGMIRTGEQVLSIDPGGTVTTERERLEADHVLNCAGLFSDRLARSAGHAREVMIIPFRGEYYTVADVDVRSMIYQPPDLRFPFLSVHMTRHIDGTVTAGPTAVLAMGREAYNARWNRGDMMDMLSSPNFWCMPLHGGFLKTAWTSLAMSLSKKRFHTEVARLIGHVPSHDLSPYRSGIRAQLVSRSGRLLNDLVLEQGPRVTHILNAVSPGMTASLAFASHIADRLTPLKSP